MKRYYYEMAASLTLYMIMLAGSLTLLQHLENASTALRVAVTLMPMLPAALMCWAIVRNLRQMDEMHLRIQFEALGFAFAASALLTFSYGFLENVGFPHLNWTFVWPVMGLMWIIGLQVARRRYQ
ncbi:hypothetical protein [Pseudomonas sp. NPDC096950]|uniref:hypothetical protein n=1 Tax=Pseudomonas sp. NPDC096950 TaxID=3364485 RepID=UPI00383B1B03